LPGARVVLEPVDPDLPGRAAVGRRSDEEDMSTACRHT
jgi:hypothetical protein